VSSTNSINVEDNIWSGIDHLYTQGIKEGLKCYPEESLIKQVKNQNIDYLSLHTVDDVGGRI